MPEWLREIVPAGTAADLAQLGTDLGQLASCLLWSAFFGVAVAAIYFVTQRRGRAETSSLISTLVLMTILLAMVTLVIGHNLARAFGLVGVLSIVRFRTIVDDTRDTAFVIFAVVIGMAAGAKFYTLAGVSLPIIGLVAYALNRWSRSCRSGMTSILIVKIAISPDPESVVKPTLAKHLNTFNLISVETAKQGATLELRYLAKLRAEVSVVALILELNRVEGVQGVEWKEPSDR
ncbi:MAG: DUF4956 domain-containing protein [Planctomycetes bacterium]|nr:DUF4956 domain-containing protein [Planctomycetota bacterium]